MVNHMTHHDHNVKNDIISYFYNTWPFNMAIVLQLKGLVLALAYVLPVGTQNNLLCDPFNRTSC